MYSRLVSQADAARMWDASERLVAASVRES
jgi:hypothetical protein